MQYLAIDKVPHACAWWVPFAHAEATVSSVDHPDVTNSVSLPKNHVRHNLTKNIYRLCDDMNKVVVAYMTEMV